MKSKGKKEKVHREVQPDQDKLVEYGLWLLEWHNKRAINFGERASFWIGTLAGILITFFGIAINKYQSIRELDPVFLTAVTFSAGYLALSLIEFRKVLQSMTVSTVDDLDLAKFAHDVRNGNNLESIAGFLVDKTFSGDKFDPDSMLHGAVKEADKRAEHFELGVQYSNHAIKILFVGCLYFFIKTYI